MPTDRTRDVMSRYWSADVVFTHMATGQEHRGSDAVLQRLDYMYRQAFDVTAEIRSRIC
jgi:hypothetical protein